jgi:hypothetical protein
MFKKNKKAIDEHNAKDAKYKKGVNQFTDMSEDEVIKAYTGYQAPANLSTFPWADDHPDVKRQLNSFKTLPTSYGKNYLELPFKSMNSSRGLIKIIQKDLRTGKCLNPIRDQGGCGYALISRHEIFKKAKS